MKQFFKYIRFVWVWIALQGCQDQLVSEGGLLPDTPVHISSRIQQAPTARVAGNQFEQDDEIGVYLVPYTDDNTQPGIMEESGYAPNVPYQYNGSRWQPVSGKDLLWPGVRKADVYGYYPYDGAVTTPGAYRFQVKNDQRAHADYSLSDFLWTKKENLSPVKNVELVFSHLLSKVNVNLRSGQEGQSLDADRLTVTVVGVQTVGLLNLSAGTATAEGNPQRSDVTLRRQTAAAEDYEVSFTGIVIPQDVPSGQRLILIEHKGANYSYRLPENLSFLQGTTKTFNIVVNDWGITVTVHAIQEWDDGGEMNGNINKPAPRILDLSAIDWDASNVHHIYDGRALIGQVAKEYVYQENKIDYPAVVVYPVDTDGNVNLTKGFVAQVFNRTMNSAYRYDINTGHVHGGAVAFNSANNTLSSFSNGTRPIITKVEIVSADAIAAADDHAIPVLSTAPYTLTDIDGNVYPIVKVATQYWIRENLKTEHYRDGTAVPVFYYNHDRETFRDLFGGLYTWVSATDNRGLAPEGWKIPSENEWYALRNYLYPYPAPKLKKPGIWSLTGNADNVTGFSGLPGGRKLNTNAFTEIYDYGQWWSETSKTTADAWRVYFGNATTIGSGNLSKAYTQSVRLVRNH